MQTQDRVGQQFGNYRLTSLLGYGGYAEVYLAEHLVLNNNFRAIKVLTGTNLKDYQGQEFLTEARTVANLQSLNTHIVQIQDVGIQVSKDEYGVDTGIPYIIMEYAAEGTLRKLYPQGTKVQLEQIIFYVNQVAEALQCAHDQSPPIVHRDVKPENMLLRSRDHLLLSDFGIAVTGQTGILVKPDKTIPVAGTAFYIAPEQLSGNTRRASDQYSLAIVVYEWLCGSCPFVGGTKDEICLKQLSASPPPLYPVYPHVTREIEAVVMRALEKKPENRYPTVKAFAHELEVAVQSAIREQKQQWQTMLANAGRQQAARQGEQEGAIGAVQNQLNRGQGVYPQNHIAGTTEPVVQQRALPSAVLFTVSSPQPLKNSIQEFFEFSSGFARDRRYVAFRSWGIVLNMFSAVIIGLLLRNIYMGLGGLIVPFLLFALCVRAIEEKLALFFGILIALYWGWIGWEIGNVIAPLLRFNRLIPHIFIAIIFFSISFSLHVWYVSRKNL